MAAESSRPNIIHFDPERRSFDDPNLEQLFRDVSRSVKELKRKNQGLEEENAGLLAALGEANERIERLERCIAATPRATPGSLHEVDHLLLRAEAADLTRKMAMAPNDVAFDEAISVSLEFQKAAVSLLEDALQAMQARRLGIGEGAGRPLAETVRSISSQLADQDDIDHQSRPVALNEGRRDLSPTDEEPTILTANPVPIELIASTFRNFATLTGFHKAIRALPGVVNVRALEFDKGKLRLAVDYSGGAPLAGELAELSQFSLRFVAVEENSIEVVFDQDNLMKGHKANRDRAR
ncbi:MAG: hypothetical protein M1358_02370 [Chloroflexi bacterium]|nr:hypothetical protein [Chloroflexota bacterium]